MGAKEQAERVGREYQKAAEVGFEPLVIHSVKSTGASRPLLLR